MTFKGSEDSGYWAHRSGSTTTTQKHEPPKQVSPTPPLSASVIAGKSNRNDFPLDRNRVALLIIDIQDFLSKPAAAEKICNVNEKYLYEQSLSSALKNIEILLSSFRRMRYEDEASTKKKVKPEIIFTYLEALTEDCRDISIDYKLSGPPLSSLPTPSTPAIFLPNISPQPDEIRIPKTSCSVFLSTNINYVLRNLNVEQLVLCGQITNQCVESTCRDAADLGYFVTVVQDACAANSLLDQEHSLSNMMGFARIMNTEQVVQELSHSKVMHPPQEYPSRSAPCSGAKITVLKNSRPPILSLLLALRAAGVHFLRYAALDCTNGIRCKAVPLKRLLSNPDLINLQVCVAEACFAGMAGFCDGILNESGFSASNVLVLKPDLGMPFTSQFYFFSVFHGQLLFLTVFFLCIFRPSTNFAITGYKRFDKNTSVFAI